MASDSIHDLHKDLFAGDGEEARAVDPKTARRKAMDFLARREYGQVELVRKLQGAGYAATVAETTVQQLTTDGLQDDRRYAGAFVQSRINQGKGPARIRADLGQRGIASALVDAALEASGEDWCALARQIRRRKFGNALPADFRDKARQMRFLQYRGFEQEQIQAAVGADDD